MWWISAQGWNFVVTTWKISAWAEILASAPNMNNIQNKIIAHIQACFQPRLKLQAENQYLYCLYLVSTIILKVTLLYVSLPYYTVLYASLLYPTLLNYTLLCTMLCYCTRQCTEYSWEKTARNRQNPWSKLINGVNPVFLTFMEKNRTSVLNYLICNHHTFLNVANLVVEKRPTYQTTVLS